MLLYHFSRRVGTTQELVLLGVKLLHGVGPLAGAVLEIPQVVPQMNCFYPKPTKPTKAKKERIVR